MSRIRWTSDAVDQLEDVVKHIQRDNPDAAAWKVTQGIYAAVRKLEGFPSLGRVGEKEGTRELVHTPYVIVYRLEEDVAEILYIWHGAQDWR